MTSEILVGEGKIYDLQELPQQSELLGLLDSKRDLPESPQPFVIRTLLKRCRIKPQDGTQSYI